MARRLIYIFLLLTTVLFSCTDMDERTADVFRETVAEGLADTACQTAVLSDDDSRQSPMAQQGETVSVPTCIPTPATPQGVSAAKQSRTGQSLLRIPVLAVAAAQTQRHQLPIIFAKAGTAFVSPRAANYYVFALRRILC
ncbi:MAG: hypothetical protein NC344_01735 [Bacteroidales bacterium]|nr:hypothetical protein [Bacteroidales bacterium]MCM1146556.1 hypothetical protein [Bacteroidales bacterium]MCM1205948.1 hypothetical protein [Bacillota bacterium]MCM1510174.1 hypothetical protein [Clostridium sp.]